MLKVPLSASANFFNIDKSKLNCSDFVVTKGANSLDLIFSGIPSSVPLAI